METELVDLNRNVRLVAIELRKRGSKVWVYRNEHAQEYPVVKVGRLRITVAEYGRRVAYSMRTGRECDAYGGYFLTQSEHSERTSVNA